MWILLEILVICVNIQYTDSDSSGSLDCVCVYVDAIRVCVKSEPMCLLAQLYPTDMQQVT